MPQKSYVKIISTIGPSSWDKEVLSQMIENGVDAIRINASFADGNEISRVTQLAREISPKIAVIVDLMGHKVRVGGINKEIFVKLGESIHIFPNSNKVLSDGYISTSYDDLYKFVKDGDRIIIDDGEVELNVKQIVDKEIITVVTKEGEIKKGKTVSIPNVYLEFPPISDKDLKDIEYAKQNKVDYVACSFIRNANDLINIKKELGGTGIKVIAKIEDGQGVKNIDEIIDNSDAIMVARGDLGIELPLEKIPLIQKDIINRCNQRGRVVIVATQLLESIKENSHPTRAEISDVANAVLDGADALMLSQETSIGKFPIEAVKYMNKTIAETQSSIIKKEILMQSDATKETDAICKHILDLNNDLNIKAIIVLTKTGKTVLSTARHRNNIPIYAVTPDLLLLRQLSIVYGVDGIYIKDFATHRDEIIKQAVMTVYSKGNLELDDKVAIISGSSIYNKSINSILEIVKVYEVV